MKAKQPRAFTLIELLVVIAIIGILAAVLLPVLEKAIERGRQAVCISNLKQWAMAQQVYSNDNNSELVGDGMPYMSGENPAGAWCNSSEPYGTPLDPYAWFNQLPPMMGDKPLGTNFLTETSGRGINGNSKGYQYMPFPGKNGRMWQCPSASMSPATIENGTLQAASGIGSSLGPGGCGFFSYDMNIDLKRNPNDSTGQSALLNDTMPKTTAFRQADATVLMFDCVFDPVTESSVNGSPGYNSVNPANRYRSYAARHSGGGIISFLDGHASYYKDFYITNSSSNGGANEALLPDIIWNAVYRKAEFGG